MSSNSNTNNNNNSPNNSSNNNSNPLNGLPPNNNSKNTTTTGTTNTSGNTTISNITTSNTRVNNRGTGNTNTSNTRVNNRGNTIRTGNTTGNTRANTNNRGTNNTRANNRANANTLGSPVNSAVGISNNITSTISNNNTSNTSNTNNTNNTAKNTTSNNKTKNTNAEPSEKLKISYEGVKNKIVEYYESAKNTILSENIFQTILTILLLSILFIALYFLGKYIITTYFLKNRPVKLFTGVKAGNEAYIISQDPLSKSFKAIERSVDEQGIEFTYGMWLYIEKAVDEKQHIFHKGSKEAHPNMAPAVYLQNDDLTIYMNSLKTIDNEITVKDMPVKKWVYLTITVNNHVVDVYLNGYLKERKELNSLVKQNNGHFWCNMNGGFNGFIADITYFPYSIELSDLISIVESGPSKSDCVKTDDNPPYLNRSWFFF